MNPKISIITLAVDNLERSLSFYRDGLGFPTKGVVQGFADHVHFELESGLSLVLFLRSEVAKIAKQPVDVKSSSECILSYIAGSKQEVDNILQRAQTWGATLQGSPEEQPWGYYGYFKDPDGHLWEILWMQH